jgi:hypothetical protein
MVMQREEKKNERRKIFKLTTCDFPKTLSFSQQNPLERLKEIRWKFDINIDYILIRQKREEKEMNQIPRLKVRKEKIFQADTFFFVNDE